MYLRSVEHCAYRACNNVIAPQSNHIYCSYECGEKERNVRKDIKNKKENLKAGLIKTEQRDGIVKVYARALRTDNNDPELKKAFKHKKSILGQEGYYSFNQLKKNDYVYISDYGFVEGCKELKYIFDFLKV